MQKIIGISLICLVLSTRGDEVCSTDKWGISICKNQGTITKVSNIGEFPSLVILSLPLDTDTAIGPNSFRGLEIFDLGLLLPPSDDRSSLHSLTLQSESFAGLSKLTILTIENADISFTGNPLAPLGTLIYLQFKVCNFKEVPTDLLVSLSDLEKLSFEDNQISTIRSNAFASLTHLEILNLKKNNITSLESGSFNGLDELRTLDLSSNSFTAVPGIFNGLNHLKELDLSEAFVINGFDPSILQDLPELTDLRLSKNNLTSLQPGIFNGIPHISHLILYGNCFRHVPKNVFEQLKSLKYVSLAENQIETIEPLAFSGLNLFDLNLVGNNLKKIATNTFNGVSVDRLTLWNNDMEELEPQAFNGLTAKVLYLSTNKLRKIDSEDLSGLKTWILDLRGNKIETIAEDAFENAEVKKLKMWKIFVKTPDGSEWSAPDSVVLWN